MAHRRCTVYRLRHVRRAPCSESRVMVTGLPSPTHTVEGFESVQVPVHIP